MFYVSLGRYHQLGRKSRGWARWTNDGQDSVRIPYTSSISDSEISSDTTAIQEMAENPATWEANLEAPTNFLECPAFWPT